VGLEGGKGNFGTVVTNALTKLTSTVECSIFRARDRHELSMSSIAFQPKLGTISGCVMSFFGNDAARRGERGGREGKKGGGDASGETMMGESEVLSSSSSAVATDTSRTPVFAGLLSRREDTVTARGRLLVRGLRDKEVALPALTLLPRESVRWTWGEAGGTGGSVDDDAAMGVVDVFGRSVRWFDNDGHGLSFFQSIPTPTWPAPFLRNRVVGLCLFTPA